MELYYVYQSTQDNLMSVNRVSLICILTKDFLFLFTTITAQYH